MVIRSSLKALEAGSSAIWRGLLSVAMLLIVLMLSGRAAAEIVDPLDPFDPFRSTDPFEDIDVEKTTDQLLWDAEMLFAEERPLDARTKLLKVLHRDPTEFRGHLMLAGYYIAHVGHFRLALKHTKRAQELFEAKYGPPAYQDPFNQMAHSQLLYLLAQARLNLDNYQAALDTLDEYTSYGYSAGWYPGSRAWILMKLGRLNEAIAVARMGVLLGAEQGRTLNMLGILLSMTGERESSLKVFREAILYEFSQGSMGQPATPLNNAGEVYRELFEDSKAESHWLRAIALPDGCEHVLPSLNLVLLYIEQTRIKDAKKAMDDFEACVAQYPLRNGEEHRALVHLARGRIALHAGDPDYAIKHLKAALARQQWFGKIGTSIDDLRVGAMISLAQAFEAKMNHLKLTAPTGITSKLAAYMERAKLKVRVWWLMRRAREVLIEDLAHFEDLLIRSTDSMLEYSTLGRVIRDLPVGALEKRLLHQKQIDNRPEAHRYYDAYLAERLLHTYTKRERGGATLVATLGELRPKLDSHLEVHLLLNHLSSLPHKGEGYSTVANRIFALKPAALRNAGFLLPVRTINCLPPTVKALLAAGFLEHDEGQNSTVTCSTTEDGLRAAFAPSTPAAAAVEVGALQPNELANALAAAVFSTDL